MRRARHIDGLHRARIEPGIVHRGRERARRRVKILHLLGHVADAVQIFRQLYRVLKLAPRVGGHEIRHKILLHAVLLIQAEVFVAEFQIFAERRLAHVIEHALGFVLGRDLQLAADMVAHKLGEKFFIFARLHIIVAQARADEYFFNALELAQPAQKLQIIAVIRVHRAARARKQTALVAAQARFALLRARRTAEIRRRAADIMNVKPSRFVSASASRTTESWLRADTTRP